MEQAIGVFLFFGACVLAAFGLGKRRAKTDATIHELEKYRNTREKMDEVPRANSPTANRKWLHRRSQPPGNM